MDFTDNPLHLTHQNGAQISFACMKGRYVFLSAAIACLLSACGPANTPTAEGETGPNDAIRDNRAIVDSFYKAIDYDMGVNAVAQASDAFISNPFADIQNLEAAKTDAPYIGSVEVPVRRVAKPEPNRHDSSLTDSIVTLRFEAGSHIELYRKTDSGEFLLLGADIRTPRCTLRDNIRVGMTESELQRTLSRLMLVQTYLPGRIEVEHPIVSSMLIFHMLEPEEGATEPFVARIEYTGYVD